MFYKVSLRGQNSREGLKKVGFIGFLVFVGFVG
jgi:hypothetical protein